MNNNSQRKANPTDRARGPRVGSLGFLLAAVVLGSAISPVFAAADAATCLKKKAKASADFAKADLGCRAALLECVATRCTQGKIGEPCLCYSKAEDCVAKAGAKLASAFAKAEAKGACPTTGDAAAVTASVAECTQNALSHLASSQCTGGTRDGTLCTDRPDGIQQPSEDCLAGGGQCTVAAPRACDTGLEILEPAAGGKIAPGTTQINVKIRYTAQLTDQTPLTACTMNVLVEREEVPTEIVSKAHRTSVNVASPAKDTEIQFSAGSEVGFVAGDKARISATEVCLFKGSLVQGLDEACKAVAAGPVILDVAN